MYMLIIFFVLYMYMNDLFSNYNDIKDEKLAQFWFVNLKRDNNMHELHYYADGRFTAVLYDKGLLKWGKYIISPPFTSFTHPHSHSYINCSFIFT